MITGRSWSAPFVPVMPRGPWLAATIPVVLLLASDVAESLVAGGPNTSFAGAVISAGRRWGIWLVLAPGIAAWASALHARPPRERLALHAIALAAVTVLHIVVHARPRLHAAADDARVVIFEVAMASILYAVVLGAHHLVMRAARARARELAAAREEAADARIAQLADAARLAQLYAQLQPHFLFNALNGASALVLRGETERAVTAISRIGQLLRRTLDLQGTLEIPLEQELRMLEDYVAIERERVGPRLNISIHVAADCGVAAIPPFVLQPLVENAVHHAFVDPRTSTIEIAARRTNGSLLVEVRDDGPGITPGAQAGVGLVNSRERLRRQYGCDASLDVAASAGGTLASLRIPFRHSQPCGPVNA